MVQTMQVIAYQGSGDDGFIQTVDVDSEGNISIAGTYESEHDTSKGEEHTVMYVTSTIYAIAYAGSGNDGFIKTVNIASNGSIGNTIDILEFDITNGDDADIISKWTQYYPQISWNVSRLQKLSHNCLNRVQGLSYTQPKTDRNC